MISELNVERVQMHLISFSSGFLSCVGISQRSKQKKISLEVDEILLLIRILQEKLKNSYDAFLKESPHVKSMKKPTVNFLYFFNAYF